MATLDSPVLDEVPADPEKPLPINEAGDTPKDPPKRGRGRPPGSPNRNTTPRGHTADIAAAMGTMGGAYDFILLGLNMVSPVAAAEWAGKVDTLQATNKRFFEADPKLAARVARIGSTGGSAGFLIANALAIIPVIQIAIPDIQRLMSNDNPEG